MLWPTRPRLTTGRVIAAVLAVASAIIGVGLTGRAPKPARAEDQKFLQIHDEALAARHLTPDSRGGVDPRSSDRLNTVSLVQLIATPERFHKKAVRVEGFLHVKFEGNALYLSKDDADHLINRNGLWVDFGGDWAEGGPTPRQFDRKYVLIEGLFDMEGHGHLGAFSGRIHDVWRVMELRQWYKD